MEAVTAQPWGRRNWIQWLHFQKSLRDIKYSTYKICNKIFTEFHKIIQISVLKKEKKKSKKDVGGEIKPASCKTCCWYHGRELHFPFHFQDGMCSESRGAIGQMSPWNKDCSWHKWEQLPREKKGYTKTHLVPLCRRMLKQSLCINLLSKKYEV